ncbi:MAG: glycosyltransferase, partial [Gammaproteobacteria bacterium]
MKFVLLIRSLGRAGTEVQAKNLASGLRSAGHDVCVVTFYPGGFYEAELSKADIEVINLGKRGRWHVLGFFRAWIRVLIEKKPDVVYSFLTGANLVAVVARVIRRKTRIYWGMRTAAPDGSYGKADLFGRIEFWISRYAVRLVHGVICNSHAGYHFLKSNGVPTSKLVVIGNGIDTDFFCRDRLAARSILEEHSLPEGKKLIGTVARLSPSKGHRMFIEAAARYLEKWGDAHFLIVGGGSSLLVSAGDTGYEAELRQLAENLGIGARLSWLGERTDMPRIYSALTVNTLCSRSLKILTVADLSDRGATRGGGGVGGGGSG